MNTGEKLVKGLKKYFKTGELSSSNSHSEIASQKKSDEESENEFWDPFKEKKVLAYKESTYEKRKELGDQINEL